mgnify:CR=1 FL=1
MKQPKVQYIVKVAVEGGVPSGYQNYSGPVDNWNTALLHLGVAQKHGRKAKIFKVFTDGENG